MRLIVTTPTTIVVDRNDVVSLRAEDDTGSFGILDGHADFLTALGPSVVSWRTRDGGAGHCAVRQGILVMEAGNALSIAAREAIASDDLERLEGEVMKRFATSAEEERAARVEAVAMRLKAIRRIIQYLRVPGASGFGAAP